MAPLYLVELNSSPSFQVCSLPSCQNELSTVPWKSCTFVFSYLPLFMLFPSSWKFLFFQLFKGPALTSTTRMLPLTRQSGLALERFQMKDCFTHKTFLIYLLVRRLSFLWPAFFVKALIWLYPDTYTDTVLPGVAFIRSETVNNCILHQRSGCSIKINRIKLSLKVLSKQRDDSNSVPDQLLPFLPWPPYHNKFIQICFSLKIFTNGTSLVVQWLRLHTLNAGSPGSIPGQGTRSHMHAITMSSHATTKSTCCN